MADLTPETLREATARLRDLAKHEAEMAEMQGEGGDPLMASACLADSHLFTLAADILDGIAATETLRADLWPNADGWSVTGHFVRPARHPSLPAAFIALGQQSKENGNG